MTASPSRRNTALVAYLRLVRIPNVFTALADVMMGYLFMHHRLAPVATVGCLLAASAALYMAGMVWNDVWDVDRDRAARPDRPLPAGTISMVAARRMGCVLLLSGITLATAAGFTALPGAGPRWRGGVMALLLAAAIVAYDGGLKQTILGPLAMGLCRSLNVLLGMSTGIIHKTDAWWLGFPMPALFVAGTIGVYVAGITWFARTEQKRSARWQLGAATVVMALGLGGLAFLYRLAPRLPFRANVNEETWFLLWLVIGFTLIRRYSRAVAEPTPARVQAAVTSGIWSLIVLNAAICLLVSPPLWAIVVLTLLLPTIVLGQWFKAT